MTTSSLREVQHRLSSRERVCSSMFIKSVWRRWRASRVSWRLALRLVMITGIFLALYILSSLNTSTSPTHNSMHVRREGVGPQARTSIKDIGWTVGGTQQLGHHDVDNISKDHPVGQPTASPHKQQFPYGYLINEPHICDHDVNIINMIPIALTRLKRRLYIRELWGQRKYSSKMRMKTVFVVGITNSNYQSQLLHESQHYHDIIQLDFVDSYFNLTLKTLSILHWTQNFCPGAKWILKSDDDVLVNPFTLTEYLTQHPTADFVCKMNRNLQVCREEKWCPKKWQVSYEEYPFNLYPLSCHGFVYVISRKMARLVYASANKTHPYRMEDVYFTGIVAKHFNPVRQHLSKYLFPIQIKTYTNLPELGKLLFLLKPDLIKGFELTMWERILQESYNHTVTKNSGTAF